MDIQTVMYQMTLGTFSQNRFWKFRLANIGHNITVIAHDNVHDFKVFYHGIASDPRNGRAAQ